MFKKLTFLLLISISSASRILFLFPTPSKSHMVIVHSLSKTLAERGHEVTVVSPFPLDERIKNHREIQTPVPSNVQNLVNKLVKDSSDEFFITMIRFVFGMVDMGYQSVQSEEFKKILNEKFDLLIIGMTYHNFLLGFGDHFKCPTAVLSVQKHFSTTTELVGNPYEPHAVPNYFLKEKEMTFIWRVKNFLMDAFELLMIRLASYYQKITYK